MDVSVGPVHSCALIDRADQFEAIAASFFDRPDADRFERVVVGPDETWNLYGDIDRYGPETVADWFAERGQQACGRGLAGIRVVADVTPLLHDERARRLYRAYELVIDRRMRREGCLFGLCVIDASKVDASAAMDVCRLHEAALPVTDFQFFTRPGGYHLGGEVVASNVDSFVRLLADVEPRIPLHVDLGDCQFIEHRALVAIDEAAARSGVPARLEHASTVAATVVRLLRLDHIEIAS